MPLKQLEIGQSDFRNIITGNSYFVDKSLFIEEIIKAYEQHYYLLESEILRDYEKIKFEKILAAKGKARNSTGT